MSRKNSKFLQGVMKLAGRYTRLARGLQIKKSERSAPEVSGICLSSSLRLAMPIEIAKFCVPELEVSQIRKMTQGHLISREKKRPIKQQKGPIIVVVDESGSMQGDKIENAKAIAMSFIHIAKMQRRWIGLVGFSGGTDGTRCYIKPGENKDEEILKWVEHFFGGGTSLDVPIKQLPEVYWKEMNPPAGKTDTIFLTDAIVQCPSKMRKEFLAWKKENQVKSYGIILNNNAGDMASLCDKYWLLDRLDTKSEAVETILGI